MAADNEFEREFAHFLQDATDVTSFAKLPDGDFGFTIEYTDSATNLRYYEPDFVAVTATACTTLHRDEGPGEHRRRPQGSGGDDLVRERHSPDGDALAVHQGSAD